MLKNISAIFELHCLFFFFSECDVDIWNSLSVDPDLL